MKITDRLAEFHLTIDDVRWYLCVEKTKEWAGLQATPFACVEWMHSKRLEADLYNMEAVFLENLQRELDERKTDEATVLEILYRINREKANRRQRQVRIDPPKAEKA